MTQKTSDGRYRFKFSFVMPVFNVEKYLDEAVQSIINQTMDFEKNLQIVFVNDGSQDDSEAICLKYKDKYPNNVKYIKQKNQGTEAARNKGVKNSDGKYISFFDSDDKISANTTSEVYDFFELHYDEVDFVSIKMKYFEAKTGDHPLNNKITHSRVINIDKEFKSIQSACGPAFVKAEAFSSGWEFNVAALNVADAEFLTKLALDKMAYGVVATPMYYYRQRLTKDSISSFEQGLKEYYLVQPRTGYLSMAEYSVKKLGYVPKYVQWVLLYYLKQHFREWKPSILNNKELSEYKKVLDEVLQYIDDELIADWQNKIPLEFRIYMLSRKYKKDILKVAEYRADGFLYLGDVKLFNASNTLVNFDFIKIEADTVEIHGWFGGFPIGKNTVSLKVNGKIYKLKNDHQPAMERWWLDEKMYQKTAFVATLPHKGELAIEPVFMVDSKPRKVQLRFGKFSGLNWERNGSYKVADDHFLIHRHGKVLIEKYNLIQHAGLEAKYLLRLAKNKHFEAVGYRIAYHLAKPFWKGKKIWIVSDRSYSTGDNAYYLFRYAAKHKDKVVRPYFALVKGHERYDEIKNMGKIVPFAGFRHKLLFLLSNKAVSAYTDDPVYNLFGTKYRNYFDLYDFDYVYLQHGVLAVNLGKTLSRYNKNMALITVSSARERDSILKNPDYAYTPDRIVITGQARFDGLISKPKKKVIFMPTWRTFIRGLARQKDGIQTDLFEYNGYFKKTEYFKFYNSLINDERIVNALRRNGYEGEFYIHPALARQSVDFQGNDMVKIMTPLHDYEKAMTEADMMVTDYSGVAFDFAYMKKPLVYTQYDKERFHKEHYKEGYFSFEKDGFGPVAQDYESAVKEIVDVIDSGCKMSSRYQKRVDKFFEYKDRNNAKRIYKEIIKMDARNVKK